MEKIDTLLMSAYKDRGILVLALDRSCVLLDLLGVKLCGGGRLLAESGFTNTFVLLDLLAVEQCDDGRLIAEAGVITNINGIKIGDSDEHSRLHVGSTVFPLTKEILSVRDDLTISVWSPHHYGEPVKIFLPPQCLLDGKK